jgi:hypothetical protein
MYSCSAVSVRRGAGATAGGAVACAWTFSLDAPKAVSPNEAAITRKLALRSQVELRSRRRDVISRLSYPI